MEELFGARMHIELVPRSEGLIRFMAGKGMITNSHLDAIWVSERAKLIVVFVLIHHHPVIILVNIHYRSIPPWHPKGRMITIVALRLFILIVVVQSCTVGKHEAVVRVLYRWGHVNPLFSLFTPMGI